MLSKADDTVEIEEHLESKISLSLKMIEMNYEKVFIRQETRHPSNV